MYNRSGELQQILNVFVARLEDSHRRQMPDLEGHYYNLDCAVSYIHKHLFDYTLTVRRLKEQCRINGKSFSARFKVRMGYYPSEYVTHHRIEASKLLLCQTEASITEIAIVTGYASHAAYCNTFKNNTGETPTKWRKINCGANGEQN